MKDTQDDKNQTYTMDVLYWATLKCDSHETKRYGQHTNIKFVNYPDFSLLLC